MPLPPNTLTGGLSRWCKYLVVCDVVLVIIIIITKQRTVTILRHNNKLTGRMCLLGFRQVYALCTLSFLLSSIRLLVFFIQQNHTEALIFHINTFSIIDATKLFKALRLHYCKEVPVLHDRSQGHTHSLFYVLSIYRSRPQ